MKVSVNPHALRLAIFGGLMLHSAWAVAVGPPRIGASALVAVPSSSVPPPPSEPHSLVSADWGTEVKGVLLHVSFPTGAAPLGEDALPKVDSSALPQAHVVLHRGVVKVGATFSGLPLDERVMAVCIRAAGIPWSPGLESLVFERMNELVKSEMDRRGVSGRFHVGTEQEIGARFEQNFSSEGAAPVGGLGEKSHSAAGEVRPGASALQVHFEGRHVLGFLQEPSALLTCSLACSELVAASEPSRVCPAVLQSFGVEAPWGTPHLSMLSRLALASSRRPLAAVGVAGSALMMMAGLFLGLTALRKRS